MITVITSRANPLVLQYAALKTAQERYAQSLFIAEGARMCTTLYAHGMKLRHILFTPEHEHQMIQQFPFELCVRVTPQIIEKIALTETPSGIVGIFEIPEEPNAAKITPGLVLAEISTPGNMGTLIRTAAAMGVKSVVIVEGSDPWSPKVVQATAGAIGAVILFQWSWKELIQYSRTYKIPLCSLLVSGGKLPQEVPLRKSLLIVGNEAHGLPIAWQKECAYGMTIPMPGHSESLNAAIAGSIALYIGYGLQQVQN
jgi:TrmH family RNA methyltransferase